MTTVPGTYFTKEQLEADLKIDNVSVKVLSSLNRSNNIGVVYENEKQQYDKALAWYLLAARENNSNAPNNIGNLYYHGRGVPKNYQCALKWYLKSVQQNDHADTFNKIGLLFEYGHGITLDKYKALEWYCHGKAKAYKERVKAQGYHRSGTDRLKSRQQLAKETKAIIDAEKKKLEEKQDKTQEEMEILEQLKITYKLTGVDKDAWKNVPILLANSRQHSTIPVNNSVINNENEILELKRQIQLLKQEKITFESQTRQLQSLEQEKKNIVNEMEQLKSSYTALEQISKSKESTILSLNRDYQGNQQGANDMVETLKSLLLAKNNETELLKQNMERLIANQQQRIDALEQENRTLKQEKKTRKRSITQNTGHLNSNTEDGDADDINLGTPSEDEDRYNDLNYDEDD